MKNEMTNTRPTRSLTIIDGRIYPEPTRYILTHLPWIVGPIFNLYYATKHYGPHVLVSRSARKLYRRILFDLTFYPLCALTPYAVAISANPEMATPSPYPDTQHYASNPDTDEHHKSKPINTWDKPITITFHNCRENEKHHISCQFRDSTGDQHWICLMGLTEADMK